MNFDLLKIKIPSFKLSSVGRSFSLSPRRLWKNFLWFLIIFALLSFAFNAWVFYSFYFSSIEAGEFLDLVQLKTNSFERAIHRLEKKNERFEDYKTNLHIEDPS